MLYNWAAENPDKVAGIAGIYPVCDLRSYPGLDKACGAYGLTRAELEEQLDKHNPVARLAPLAKAGVPIFHIHGDADAVVPLKDNSGEVARRYEKLGGKMELKVAKGRATTSGRASSSARSWWTSSRPVRAGEAAEGQTVTSLSPYLTQSHPEFESCEPSSRSSHSLSDQ